MSTASEPPNTAKGTSAASARPQRHWLLRFAGKSTWNVLDQGLSALTNAVLFFLVVRSVGSAGGDAFATAFYLFSTVIGIQRTLAGQVLSISYSHAAGETWHTAVRHSSGMVLLLTVATGIPMAIAGALIGGRLGPVLLVTAATLPGLILQDTCRMAFFAQSRAKAAAFNDALWAVLQFGAIGLLIAADAATTPLLVLAWGGSATVCAVVGFVQLRAWPDPSQGVVWVKNHWGLSGYLLGEYLLTTGAFNGGFLIVGAIAGQGALTALRGAQVLLGPLGIISTAIMTFALPELSRRAHLSNATRWRVAGILAAAMALLSLAYTVVLLLLPTAAGEFLFGADWDIARKVLLPVAIGTTSAGACLGPAVVIYALGRAKQTFGLILIEAPMVLTLLVSGAIVGGASLAAWGLATTQTIMVAFWFWQLRRILSESQGSPVKATTESND